MLADQYQNDTEGKRTSQREAITVDRNDPNRYLIVAEFDSYEAAMENSNLPETEARHHGCRRAVHGERITGVVGGGLVGGGVAVHGRGCVSGGDERESGREPAREVVVAGGGEARTAPVAASEGSGEGQHGDDGCDAAPDHAQ